VPREGPAPVLAVDAFLADLVTAQGIGMPGIEASRPNATVIRPSFPPRNVAIRGTSWEPTSVRECAVARHGRAAANILMAATIDVAPKLGNGVNGPGANRTASGRFSHCHSGREKPAQSTAHDRVLHPELPTQPHLVLGLAVGGRLGQCLLAVDECPQQRARD
jgi:hypothetical protein